MQQNWLHEKFEFLLKFSNFPTLRFAHFDNFQLFWYPSQSTCTKYKKVAKSFTHFHFYELPLTLFRDIFNGVFFSFLGTFLVTTFFYWLSAAIFMVMDYTQMPSFLMKYKIQPGKNTPPPTSKVLKVSIFN